MLNSGISMELLLKSQKRRLYIYLIILIIVSSMALRLYGINLRPIFTDEAVHYNFIHQLWETQKYQYKDVITPVSLEFINDGLNLYSSIVLSPDSESSLEINDTKYRLFLTKSLFLKPVNDALQSYYYFKHIIKNPAYVYDPVYHGPFLYYLGDVVFNLANDHNLYLLRLPVVISSILAIFCLFLFRESLGKWGFLLSLLLVSLSPGLIYFSNLANYENYFATGSILGVGLLLMGIKKRSPAILFSSGFVLLALITIKETALVTWFAIVVATILTYITLYLPKRPSRWLKKLEDMVLNLAEGKYTDSILRYLLPALLCFALSGLFFVLMYSSCGSNPHGIHDGLTSWMYWKNTGAQSGHVKPFGFYTDILLTYDFMLIFLFFTGAIYTLYMTKDKYKIFIVYWALVVWLVYAFIPYKTPWLIINFIYPFAIVAGTGWDMIIKRMKNKLYKYLMAFFIALLAMNTVFIAVKVKWIDHDKEANKMAYVHTYRDFEEEIKALYSLILASPDGDNTEITVAAPEYWPLPAYLLDYRAVGYFGGVKGRDLNTKAPIIINDKRDNPELRELLLESDVNDYFKLRDFEVRPGVIHSIFVSHQLMKAYLESGYYKLLISPGRSYLLQEPPWD